MQRTIRKNNRLQNNLLEDTIRSINTLKARQSTFIQKNNITENNYRKQSRDKMLSIYSSSL